MYYYNVFGLNFASELDLPMFNSISEPDEIDVHIKFGSVPESLENPKDARVLFEAKPNQFLLRFTIYPVRYFVENVNLLTHVHTIVSHLPTTSHSDFGLCNAPVLSTSMMCNLVTNWIFQIQLAIIAMMAIYRP